MTRKKDGRHDNPGPPTVVGGSEPAIVLSVRIPKKLKTEAEKAAKSADITVSEWWRRAGQAQLGTSS